MDIKSPTAEQIEAMKRFAAAHGRCWKQELREAWMSGYYPQTGLQENDDAYLQQVRNTLGPGWLIKWVVR